MELQNSPNKLSRRNWLRDAAIATTGTALIPSLLTSCSDHRIPPVVGVGGPEEPTLEQLRKASDNLKNMEAWRDDLYGWTSKYQDDVYHMVNSGRKPSGWESFVVTVFTDIAIGLATAALAAAEVTAPYAAPAIAIAGATITKWALGQDSPGFPSAFSDFEDGQLKIQKALSTMLIDLQGDHNDYAQLRKKWNDVYEFNGHKYTISDLASEKSHFPVKSEGTPYTDLLNPAYDSFRRHIWNVLFIKSANMYYSNYWAIIANRSPALYARDTHYPGYPETYLRGRYEDGWNTFGFHYFYFMIDGKYLSAETARELFIDDYPGHIMNPDPDSDPKKHGKPLTGLFPRDYVFKQFHRAKPDFFGYSDVRSDLVYDEGDPYNGKWNNLSRTSFNYEFTGGDFPQLVNK